MATDSYEALSGTEKAAVLMLALSEERAARLFSMLEIDEVMELSGIMEQTHLKGPAPPGPFALACRAWIAPSPSPGS